MSTFRVLNGLDHAALGHLIAALLKPGMNAGDHHIHLRQHFVVQIERAVGQNIHLDA